MANLLSYKSKGINHSISNGWTSVLYSTLLISGSGIAKTIWEKLFMIWLAEHDQGIIGYGMAGIDFDQIFWSVSEFEKQKEFVTGIAQKAINEKSWSKLDYETEEEVLEGLLNLWIDMFSKASAEDIKPIEDYNWYVKPDLSDLDNKCSIHNVFLNRLMEDKMGCCMICNDK